jgi:hypothetical protein
MTGGRRKLYTALPSLCGSQPPRATIGCLVFPVGAYNAAFQGRRPSGTGWYANLSIHARRKSCPHPNKDGLDWFTEYEVNFDNKTGFL